MKSRNNAAALVYELRHRGAAIHKNLYQRGPAHRRAEQHRTRLSGSGWHWNNGKHNGSPDTVAVQGYHYEAAG